MANRWSKSYIT